MNDLPKVVYHSKVALFADDITFYCSVYYTLTLIWHHFLNGPLATNGFKINISKCHARKHRRSQVSLLKFLINHKSILPESW